MKLIIVAIVALTMMGAGCSKESSTSTTQNTNTQIGQASVPTAGTAGTYKGKLETLVLIADDLPATYGPYTNNQSSGDRYIKVTDTVSGMTQQYSPQQVAASDFRFTITMPLFTFQDTASAAQYYNTQVAVAQSGLETGGTQGILDGVGDANYYQTSSYVNQSDPRYNSTTWKVWILKSNLIVTAQIVTPATFTVDELTSLLSSWEQKTASYKPATDAELLQENNSAASA